MKNFRMIGAAVLSLMVATPALAKPHDYHRQYVQDPELPVQDALRLGYGTGKTAYHSGYGGLYGDGSYPGNVYDNDHLDLAPTTPFN
jgi:hypothetical protein